MEFIREHIVIIVEFASLITAIGVIVKFLSRKMDKLFEPINRKIDNRDRRQLRYSIVEFASDLRKGIGKTRQEFEAIYEFYDAYEEIIEDLGLKNGYVDSEMEYIDKCYKALDK